MEHDKVGDPGRDVPMIDASVVICAYTMDRWDDLNRAVASVRVQVPPAHEIILVIDNNEDLQQRAAEIEGARVVSNTKARGLSGGRMTGAELATGAIIIFLDDDAFAEPGWLATLLDAYEDYHVLGAGGHVEPLWRVPKPDWFPSEFNWVIGCTYRGFPVGPKGEIRNPIGANLSVRADVYRRTGGFVGKLGRGSGGAGTCDETEFCIRASSLYPGGIWLHCPEARVNHVVSESRATWRYFLNRCRMEGTSKAVVTDLVGTQKGLGSERRYVITLAGSVLRETLTGNFRRAGAIIIGLWITTFAYARARFTHKFQPVKVPAPSPYWAFILIGLSGVLWLLLLIAIAPPF